jgi:hypothetical protein
MYGTELIRTSAVFSTATRSVPAVQVKTVILFNFIGYFPPLFTQQLNN